MNAWENITHNANTNSGSSSAVVAEGGVVSAEELLARAWDENTDPFTNAVRITVSGLRKRLGHRHRAIAADYQQGVEPVPAHVLQALVHHVRKDRLARRVSARRSVSAFATGRCSTT